MNLLEIVSLASFGVRDTTLILIVGHMRSARKSRRQHTRVVDRDQIRIDHIVVPFDQIFEAVASGRADAGLIIHEGQLTHSDRGLELWVDLGEWWHRETGLPLPLGGNVVRRDLGAPLMREIARDLKASIEYALAHRAEALAHARQFSRGLDAARTDQFVGMYVNAFTVDYGAVGRRAVAELLRRGAAAGFLPRPVDLTFVGGDG